MVQVQSTWFPLIDRYPQKFVSNIFMASTGDYQKATHTTHRSKKKRIEYRLARYEVKRRAITASYNLFSVVPLPLSQPR